MDNILQLNEALIIMLAVEPVVGRKSVKSSEATKL